jgi:hypothetical protein
MRCPSCMAENIVTRRFCAECADRFDIKATDRVDSAQTRPQCPLGVILTAAER